MALASRSERSRVPKTSSEETGLVNDTVPPSTKYKNCNGRTVAELLVVQIRDGGSEKVGRKIPSKECVWNHLFFETSFGGDVN